MPLQLGKHDRLIAGAVLIDSRGNTYVSAATASGTFQVRRITAAGTLDTTWAPHNHGLLVFSGVPGGKILLDHSDRLDVLVGNSIHRFAANGSVDNTFASGGTLTLSNFAAAPDFAIDTTNKLYVVGSVNAGPKTHRHTVYQVVRYRSAGTIDPTFQDGGRYVRLPSAATAVNQTNSSAATRVGVAGDGSVVVVGLNSTDYTGTPDDDQGRGASVTYAVEFKPDGTLNAAYGKKGVSATIAGNYYDDGNTDVEPTAIGYDGSVYTYVTTNTQTISDPQQSTRNQVIAASGKSVSTVYYAQDRNPDDDYVGIRATQFVDRTSSGGTLIGVSGGAPNPLNSGGDYDTTFHLDLTRPYFSDIAATSRDRVVAVGSDFDDAAAVRVVRFYADR